MIKSQLKIDDCLPNLMSLVKALDAAAELHISKEEDSTIAALMVLMQVLFIQYM